MSPKETHTLVIVSDNHSVVQSANQLFALYSAWYEEKMPFLKQIAVFQACTACPVPKPMH